MCKHSPKSGLKRIDPCMVELVKNLKLMLKRTNYRPVGSCCGHKKYKRTVVVEHQSGARFELFSSVIIPRKKKSYKKDKMGMYYIPEVENE